MPANSVVQSLYFSGLDKLRSGNYMGAQEVLTRAAIADPNNALVHWALSAADTSGGHELHALQQAKAAFDLAHGLTYEQGLKVEARYYESKHDWPRAEETYRRLSKFVARRPLLPESSRICAVFRRETERLDGHTSPDASSAAIGTRRCEHRSRTG